MSSVEVADRSAGVRLSMPFLLRAAAAGAAWFAFAAASSVFAKKTLNIASAATSLTLMEFAAGAVMTWLYIVLAKRDVNLNVTMIRSFLPVSVAYFFGHLLTNYSFGATSLAFAHTVKALEPMVAVMLQRLIGDTDRHSTLMYLSFLPIAGGIGLASTGDLKFTWKGLILAMTSNICFGFRNVLSKKTSQAAGADVIDCFLCLSVTSTLLCLLPWFFSDVVFGGELRESLSQMEPLVFSSFMYSFTVAIMGHWAYNQASFSFLFVSGPITHSVANAARRLFLILTALIYFSHSVSSRAGLGVLLTLSGISMYAYSIARPKDSTQKEKDFQSV